MGLAQVFEFDDKGVKKEGEARKAQMRHQRDVYASAMRAEWRCTWEGVGNAQHGVDSLPLAADRDRHSLAVKCPVPPAVDAAGTEENGRLRFRVRLEAKLDGATFFGLAAVPVCDRAVGAVTRMPHEHIELPLAACTMTQPLEPFDTLTVVRQWIACALPALPPHRGHGSLQALPQVFAGAVCRARAALSRPEHPWRRDCHARVQGSRL